MLRILLSLLETINDSSADTMTSSPQRGAQSRSLPSNLHREMTHIQSVVRIPAELWPFNI